MKLTPAQVEFYEKNGFVKQQSLVSAKQLEHMLLAIKHVTPKTPIEADEIFSTKDQEQKMGNYFLESADKVSFFQEELESTDPRSKWNKAGHALHRLLPAVRSICENSNFGDSLRKLGMKKPAIIQSQFIFKGPKTGGEVRPHQDSTFLFTEPLSTIGFWLSVNEARTTNGCMWAIPGSHKTIPITERFVQTENGKTTFTSLGPKKPEFDLTNGTPMEARPGDGYFFDGSLVHWSERNNSDNSRNALVLHFIDLDCEYPADNWLQSSVPLMEL